MWKLYIWPFEHVFVVKISNFPTVFPQTFEDCHLLPYRLVTKITLPGPLPENPLLLPGSFRDWVFFLFGMF